MSGRQQAGEGERYYSVGRPYAHHLAQQAARAAEPPPEPRRRERVHSALLALVGALDSVEPECSADPARHYPADPADTAPAVEVCARCPGREPCGDLAAALGETHGVWGGQAREPRRRRPTSIATKGTAA